MVVREFYNEVWARQLEKLSEDFATLAAARDEGGHVVWPLDLLAVAFEKLMQQFILSVREQIMQLLITLEQTRKDTKRPNLFTNLRLLMLSRDHAMQIAFVMPDCFVDVTAEGSAFQRVWNSFYSQQTTMLMKHGAAAFDIPTTGKHKAVGEASAEECFCFFLSLPLYLFLLLAFVCSLLASRCYSSCGFHSHVLQP